MNRARRRVHGRSPGVGARARAGLSVVEVLVAVMLFGVATTGLAAMTFWVGTRAGVAREANQRADAVAEEGDLLASMPFDSLESQGGCKERAYAGFAYLRCVRVDEVAGDRRRVLLTVAPMAQAGSRSLAPDTLQLERTRTAPWNPLQ
ncbi:MAG: hypothetical protein IT359_14960 [Gemmatimonadaceae bacterium]|nr:hypothetical protein [Gemmatimonadaceae bacterium]